MSATLNDQTAKYILQNIYEKICEWMAYIQKKNAVKQSIEQVCSLLYASI